MNTCAHWTSSGNNPPKSPKTISLKPQVHKLTVFIENEEYCVAPL